VPAAFRKLDAIAVLTGPLLPAPLYGVLVWRPRSDFTTDDDNGRGWHLFYDTHLEDRPVLETLQQAAKALGDLVLR